MRSGVEASDPWSEQSLGNGDSLGGVLSDPARGLELFASVLRAEIRDDARRDAVPGQLPKRIPGNPRSGLGLRVVSLFAFHIGSSGVASPLLGIHYSDKNGRQK